MSQITPYLKPAWVQHLLKLASGLLPDGSSAAVWFAGKPVAIMGEDADRGNAATMTEYRFPLMLDEQEAGVLIVRSPSTGNQTPMQTWGEVLVYVLQGMGEAGQVRRAVAKETLDSYRQVALLQRATTEFNRSLKPMAVADALLKQFDGGQDGVEYGAVLLCGADDRQFDLLRSFGPESRTVFARFIDSQRFSDLAGHPTGDIINHLADSPWREQNQPELQAMLWLRLIAHGENLGLLLLASRQVDRFTSADMKRAQILVSVAATALRNAQLYAAEQNMFHSFVGAIASAIDAKSPGTAGHCRRVPEITLQLAEAVNRANSGPFADYTLNENEWESLELAAWLHDCGKVVTPEWLIDKSTKLQEIGDWIELIALRFEILRRDALLCRQEALAAGQDAEAVDQVYQAQVQKLDDDLAFIATCNQGTEFTSPEHLARLQDIAHCTWRDRDGSLLPLLTDEELHQLSVSRGTLTAEERKVVEDHVVHTLNMLTPIHFPHRLHQVPEWAANHHERINGTGYPRGLKGDQIDLPARMIALADVFEALTAPDRPYRKPWPLSRAIAILYQMKRDRHIDGDLFDLFLQQGLHLAYAEKYLDSTQIDEVDITRYLG